MRNSASSEGDSPRNADGVLPGLTIAGCRARQERLRKRLDQLGLEAALILDARHVHYLTGYWVRPIFRPVLLIERDGQATLSAPLPPAEEVAADATLIAESNRLGTLVDDQLAASLQPLGSRLTRLRQLGSDEAWDAGRSGLAHSGSVHDLAPVLRSLRRAKDADEIAFLRRLIDATEAAYAYAAETLAPGVPEMELFAGMQAAAVRHLGEAIGEFGNDFQIGAVGSAPRRRPAQEGEIAILDVTVECRGYRSDMCRSLVVGAPSERQLTAHRRVMEILARVAELVRPGVACRALYEEAKRALDGRDGWSFPHHLGHGIGLSQHESPRLNPHWDDHFEPGDVFTVEPGLYGPDLRAGLRVEQIYHLTALGLEVLTSFPAGLDGKSVKV